MPEQKIPFLNLFSAWRPEADLLPVAGACQVTAAVIDKAARSLRAEVECALVPGAELRARLERSLAAAYRMERVELNLHAPAAPAPVPPPIPVADAAPPPAEPEMDDVFKRTEEIRRQALKNLKLARPKEKKRDGCLLYTSPSPRD